MASNRTEQLLELVANELFRLRLQLHDEDDPVEWTNAMSEALGKDIIEQRKELGLMISPDLPRRR